MVRRRRRQQFIVAKNIAALELRHGTGHNVVGTFTGFLDNDGERLQIKDALGESILDFSWNDNWYPPSDGDGHTLVIRDTGIAFNDYDEPESWGISQSVGDSPGAGDSLFYTHFEGWRHAEFSAAERDDPQTGMLNSDPDGDNLDNWEEYCFGTNPHVIDHTDRDLIAVSNTGTDYAALEFTRRKDAWDILWSLRSCDGLVNWADEASTVHGTPQPAGPGLEKVTLRSSTPMGAGGRKFFRARARDRRVQFRRNAS